MKKYFGIIICAVFALTAVTFVSCNGQNAGKPNLKNSVDSVSYIMGVTEAQRQGLPDQAFTQLGIKGHEDDFVRGFSEGLKIAEDDMKAQARFYGLQFGFNIANRMLPQVNNMVFAGEPDNSIDVDQLKAGMIDVIMKSDIPADFNEANLNALIEQIKEDAQKRAKESNAKYLEDNKSKEGVVALPSGLQYKVLVEGTGQKPGAYDTVKVHYHGTTINGKVFDSSVDRGEPIEFPLNQVIRGWTEGLQLMPVGSKYILYIPYDLAYGENGNQSIAPYATLIFEVELLDVTPAPVSPEDAE